MWIVWWCGRNEKNSNTRLTDDSVFWSFVFSFWFGFDVETFVYLDFSGRMRPSKISTVFFSPFLQRSYATNCSVSLQIRWVFCCLDVSWHISCRWCVVCVFFSLFSPVQNNIFRQGMKTFSSGCCCVCFFSSFSVFFFFFYSSFPLSAVLITCDDVCVRRSVHRNTADTQCIRECCVFISVFTHHCCCYCCQFIVAASIARCCTGIQTNRKW